MYFWTKKYVLRISSADGLFHKYDEIYTRFSSSAPITVLQYFNTNWHKIREQWTMGMKFCLGNFLNTTNNSHIPNAKLKSVISRYSSLEEFIDKFFLIIRVLRSERDQKAALAAQKVPVVYHSSADTSLVKYIENLTMYAFNFVKKQMELKVKVKLILKDDQYKVDSSEGRIGVSSIECECMSWKSMGLPCHNIFAVREELGIDLYDEELCDKRWSLRYYKETQRIFQPSDSANTSSHDFQPVIIAKLPVSKKRSKSQVYGCFIYWSKCSTNTYVVLTCCYGYGMKQKRHVIIAFFYTHFS